MFLILFRLTHDLKHLYRAGKFADFLTSKEFLQEADTPDTPFSLFEGKRSLVLKSDRCKVMENPFFFSSGSVCFLIDLLQPEKASFPFMDVFDLKF